MSELLDYLRMVLQHALDPMLLVVAGLGGLSVSRWSWAVLVGLGSGLLQVLTMRKLMGVIMPLDQVLVSLCAGVFLAVLAQAVRRWLESRKSRA